MAPSDVLTWAKSCNDIVTGSNRIGFMLEDPSFIQPLRKTLISVLGDKPDFYAMTSQLTLILFNNKSFERIILKETTREFVKGDRYSWFCFWCSNLIYINISKQLGESGEG